MVEGLHYTYDGSLEKPIETEAVYILAKKRTITKEIEGEHFCGTPNYSWIFLSRRLR